MVQTTNPVSVLWPTVRAISFSSDTLSWHRIRSRNSCGKGVHYAWLCTDIHLDKGVYLHPPWWNRDWPFIFKVGRNAIDHLGSHHAMYMQLVRNRSKPCNEQTHPTEKFSNEAVPAPYYILDCMWLHDCSKVYMYNLRSTFPLSTAFLASCNGKRPRKNGMQTTLILSSALAT